MKNLIKSRGFVFVIEKQNLVVLRLYTNNKNNSFQGFCRCVLCSDSPNWTHTPLGLSLFGLIPGPFGAETHIAQLYPTKRALSPKFCPRTHSLLFSSRPIQKPWSLMYSYGRHCQSPSSSFGAGAMVSVEASTWQLVIALNSCLWPFTSSQWSPWLVKLVLFCHLRKQKPCSL